ncbi:RodZ domain-containing protein [Shewanella colwelliana]|uniref:RodZ domain-containing protein n=1 Tax=Shewanella colwelliana TaxID=23 RepID=UPI0037366C96
MTENQTDMLKDEASSNKDEAPTPKLGQLLKDAREQRGSSIAQIAEQLHLRPSIIEDIEADNFENIASATYVKGYIKNYARVVELDKAIVERCLTEYFPVASSPTMQSFSRKTTRQARDGRLMMVTYFIVFTLLALLVLWWVQKSELMSGIDLSTLTVEEVADISSDVDVNAGEPNAAIHSVDAQAATGIEPVSRANVNPSVLSLIDTDSAPQGSTTTELPEARLAQVSATDTEVTTEDTAAAQTAIAIRLSSDCWIKVTDADGKTLVNGLKVAGKELNVFGQEPFKVILGAPQSVALSINGQDVDLGKYPSGKVARLTLSSPVNL